jgi:hypothetical protein
MGLVAVGIFLVLTVMNTWWPFGFRRHHGTASRGNPALDRLTAEGHAIRLAQKAEQKRLKAQADPDEDEPYYPGTDPDGKERLPPFAGRFAAQDTAMAGVERPGGPSSTKPGATAPSPFV